MFAFLKCGYLTSNSALFFIAGNAVEMKLKKFKSLTCWLDISLELLYE